MNSQTDIRGGLVTALVHVWLGILFVAAGFTDQTIHGRGLEPATWMAVLVPGLAAAWFILRCGSESRSEPFFPDRFKLRMHKAVPPLAFGLAATLVLLHHEASVLFRLDFYLPFVWLPCYGLALMACAGADMPELEHCGRLQLLAGMFYALCGIVWPGILEKAALYCGLGAGLPHLIASVKFRLPPRP